MHLSTLTKGTLRSNACEKLEIRIIKKDKKTMRYFYVYVFLVFRTISFTTSIHGHARFFKVIFFGRPSLRWKNVSLLFRHIFTCTIIIWPFSCHDWLVFEQSVTKIQKGAFVAKLKKHVSFINLFKESSHWKLVLETLLRNKSVSIGLM